MFYLGKSGIFETLDMNSNDKGLWNEQLVLLATASQQKECSSQICKTCSHPRATGMEEGSYNEKGEKRKSTENHDFQKKSLKSEGDKEEKEDKNECELEGVHDYVKNFSSFINFVSRARDNVLFNDEDLNIIEKYRQLDLNSQKLFIKLNVERRDKLWQWQSSSCE